MATVTQGHQLHITLVNAAKLKQAIVKFPVGIQHSVQLEIDPATGTGEATTMTSINLPGWLSLTPAGVLSGIAPATGELDAIIDVTQGGY